MKVLLPWSLSLVTGLACASLKGSEQPLKPESAKSKFHFQLEKVEQEVLGPVDVVKRGCDPMLLQQMVDFLPELDRLLFWTSQEAVEVLADRNFFLEDLASRFGIDRLKAIPAHSDLKVFENFNFPKTPQRRAEAVALIYRAYKQSLFVPPLLTHLKELVYDEVLDLAVGNQECLNRFLNLSNFTNEPRMYDLIEYALKQNRFEELISLTSFIPNLRITLSGFFYYAHRLENILPVICSYLSKRPDHFKFCCSQINVSAILCLLCSDLTMSQVRELLYDMLAVAQVQDVYKQLKMMLIIPPVSNFPNHSLIGSRLYALFELFIGLRGNDFVSSEADDFKFLFKCRFENYHLTKEGADELNRPIMAALRLELFEILLCTRKLEEAFQYLPVSQIRDPLVNNKIVKDEEFCALLAARAPAWIKMNFHQISDYVFRDLNLLKAFFDVSSFSEFFQIAKNVDLFNVAKLVLEKGSMEEIRELAEVVDDATLAKICNEFFMIEMADERFAEILKVLLTFELKFQQNASSSLLQRWGITPSAFITIIERNGIAMIKWFCNHNSCNEGARVTKINYLLASILQSDEERRRILPFKNEILELLTEEGKDKITHISTPNGLNAAHHFYNMTRADLIKTVLKKVFNLYLISKVEVDELILLMVSFSRSWFLEDCKIANYVGEDFVQKTLDSLLEGSTKEFCQSVYSSLTSRGQAILRFIFAEAEKFRPQPPQEPAAAAEVADAQN